MIEKKPPKLSGTMNPDDDMDMSDAAQDQSAMRGTAFDYDEDEVLAKAGAEADGGEMPDIEADEAAAALQRQQKIKGLMFTYGVGGVFFAAVVYLAYPHFKHYFVSTAPVVHDTGVPVPQSAMTHHFGLAPSPSGQPQAPGGAMQNGPLPNSGAQSGTDAIPSGLEKIVPSAPETQTPSASTTSSAVPSAGAPAPEPEPSASASAGGGAVTADTSPSGASSSASTMQPVGPSGAFSPLDSGDKVGQLTTRLTSLEAKVDALSGQKEATSGQIQQIQASLDNLQKQVADLAAVKVSGAPAAPVHHARPRQAAVSSQSSSGAPRGGGHWELRSAMPGSALIARPGSSELQHVSVGDIVSGLGKITSIEEHDGEWTVRGTGGSVGQ